MKLPNYLRGHRRRHGLSQGDVAALLGCGSGAKVCRHERNLRLPTLQAAFAYEIIFQTPVREIFAGTYERMEKEVCGRIGVLRKKSSVQSRASSPREAFLLALAARVGNNVHVHD